MIGIVEAFNFIVEGIKSENNEERMSFDLFPAFHFFYGYRQTPFIEPA
jgi:hypothetical protein